MMCLSGGCPPSPRPRGSRPSSFCLSSRCPTPGARIPRIFPPRSSLPTRLSRDDKREGDVGWSACPLWREIIGTFFLGFLRDDATVITTRKFPLDDFPRAFRHIEGIFAQSERWLECRHVRLVVIYLRTELDLLINIYLPRSITKFYLTR